MLATASAEPLASFDVSQLDALASAALADEDIAYVGFLMADGEALAQGGDAGAVESRYVIARPIAHEGEALGEARAGYRHDAAAVGAVVDSANRETLLLSARLVGLVSALASVAIHLMIRRIVAALADAFRRAA